MSPPPPSSPEVVAGVRRVVAEALARNLDTVRADSVLMADLGAESLDFLDIVFQIEQSFGIEITRGEMERAARGDMSEEEFAPGGVISERGLATLKVLMPEAADHIRPGLRPMEILSLFTVQTFVNIVEAKRAGRTA
ncbi:MAG TPA: phosphopantetheine-binding protein [Kofleriaceae bacterium]|nr:phosphopantetheine-binding protein [Kofleriaceae bacterium]